MGRAGAIHLDYSREQHRGHLETAEARDTMKFRKRPVVVEATQWFKNGDHPEDLSGHLSGGQEKTEDQVVRYFRSPNPDGKCRCTECGFTYYVHGWIDTLEDGHRVCPGDWIITGVKGERYPCKPDIFEATYDLVNNE